MPGCCRSRACWGPVGWPGWSCARLTSRGSCGPGWSRGCSSSRRCWVRSTGRACSRWLRGRSSPLCRRRTHDWNRLWSAGGSARGLWCRARLRLWSLAACGLTNPGYGTFRLVGFVMMKPSSNYRFLIDSAQLMTTRSVLLNSLYGDSH